MQACRSQCDRIAQKEKSNANEIERETLPIQLARARSFVSVCITLLKRQLAIQYV